MPAKIKWTHQDAHPAEDLERKLGQVKLEDRDLWSTTPLLLMVSEKVLTIRTCGRKRERLQLTVGQPGHCNHGSRKISFRLLAQPEPEPVVSEACHHRLQVHARLLKEEQERWILEDLIVIHAKRICLGMKGVGWCRGQYNRCQLQSEKLHLHDHALQPRAGRV